MDAIDTQQADRQAQRMQDNRQELVERLMRAVPQDGIVQPLEGIYLARSSVSMEPLHSVVKPSFCVIAQGSKGVFLGDNLYRYDSSHYLISTVELPRLSQILEASQELPYLSFRLVLDPALVGSVMVETGHASPPAHVDVRAMDVSPLDVNLQDAVVRLVRLPKRRCSCR